MLNKVFIEGRLVKQPELHTSANGTKYCLNTLATQRDKDHADFIPVSFFGKSAELVATFCNKGDLISVEGNVSMMKRKESKFEEVTISVNGVHFLQSVKKKEEGYTHDEGVKRIYQ